MHQFTVSTNWWYFSSDSNGNLRQGGYWRRTSSHIRLALIGRESGLGCTGLDRRSSCSTGWDLRRLYVRKVQSRIDVYSWQIKVWINWKSEALHRLRDYLSTICAEHKDSKTLLVFLACSFVSCRAVIVTYMRVMHSPRLCTWYTIECSNSVCCALTGPALGNRGLDGGGTCIPAGGILYTRFEE